METEINRNTIIGHIAGLSDEYKQIFYKFIKKSQLFNKIKIIDVDNITDIILDDTIMATLFSKFEQNNKKSKDLNLSNLENKTALSKAKLIEKKMIRYWKVKMEYYINKIIDNSDKKIILIGNLSFYKNPKIYINLNITPKFFVKDNPIDRAKSIVRYNLDHSREEIINGEFDLSYLDINFLIKKRAQLQNIHTKINYCVMSLPSIINTIELYDQIKIPDRLYYASFIKYDKKIPVLTNNIQVYSEEWLALSSILTSIDSMNKINDITNTIVEKGNNNGKEYIRPTKEQIIKLSSTGYIYEILSTENFLPFPAKKSVYKYFTVKPVKINRFLRVNNVLDKIKELGIEVNVI